MNLPVYQNPSLKTDDMSPCKVADTRGKYISQLQQIKSLEEEGVLTSVEYAEQKEIILCNLKSSLPLYIICIRE